MHFIKFQIVFFQTDFKIWRHGDRTPTGFYPNDPYADPSNWPVDAGELTNTGKLQQYQLGQWLRARFGNILLDDDYSEKQI